MTALARALDACEARERALDALPSGEPTGAGWWERLGLVVLARAHVLALAGSRAGLLVLRSPRYRGSESGAVAAGECGVTSESRSAGRAARAETASGGPEPVLAEGACNA